MSPEASSPEVIFEHPVEDNLAYLEDRLQRLAAEAPGLSGTNQYPEWYYEDTERLREIVPQLQQEAADPGNISRYYVLFAKEAELRGAITGHEQSHPVQALAYQLGVDVLGKALGAEPMDGPIHTGMLENLHETLQSSNDCLIPELNTLKTAYGLETATELLGISGDEYSDQIREFMRGPQAFRWIRHLDEGYDGDRSWEENREATRDWINRAVGVASGMSVSEASEYAFTVSRRSDDESIISVIRAFDHFGVDRIRALTQATGIRGLEGYSIEQLERMEAFANDPEQAAERMQDHDVIVAMINRVGDYSGVLQDVAADFDDDNKRALFFEIDDMGDIYRRMSVLHKAGIKPSTVVLAAHSAPGQFMVSDVREKDPALHRRDIATIAGRKLVAMAHAGGEVDPGDFGYSMHGMKGLARLVDTYMQPSRAIDDADADAGRKKIIFQACSAAVEDEMNDKDDNGEKVQLGMESVISQLGKDLIESGVKTNIDIYGAPGTIQLHRSERGVHYSGHPEGMGEDRPHMNAERIRIENGVLSKEEVHDIALRK